MRKVIVLLTIFISTNFYSQKLALNKPTNFYQFSKVVEVESDSINKKFTKRFKQINLKDIEISEKSIKGTGVTSHLTLGVVIAIKYIVKVEFKKNKYKLTLTNFLLEDQRGKHPLEGLKSYKKRWVKRINKKLPEIISNIEKLNIKEVEW